MAEAEAVSRDGGCDDGTITMSPSSTLATLREAVKQVEHEDYLDGQAAITTAINEFVVEHGIEEMVHTSDLKQEENINSNLPKLLKPNRRESVNEDARMLIQQMGGILPLEPKPSESIAIEKDIHDLITDMNKTAPSSSSNKKNTSMVNARYLRALESNKHRQKSLLNKSQGNTSRYSTTLCDISKVLIESEETRWCEQFKQSTFKSYQEEMLFRNMQKVIQPKALSSSSSSKKAISPYEINRQTIKQKQQEFHESWSQLHRGGKSERDGEYMRYDDLENCTFRPKTNETKRNSSSQDNNHNPDDEGIQSGSKFENFIARQEAKERSRRQDNEFTKGKEEYEKYELDKKYCPRCNGKQSYDEVKEKRKNCPNCHVAYRPRTCWGDIEDGFYNRQNKHWLKCQENEVKRKMESEEKEKKVEVLKMDRKTGEIRRCVKEKGVERRNENGEVLKWTKELEKDFFGRHEEYKEIVQKKLLKVEKEMYGRSLDSDPDDEEDGESRETESSSRGPGPHGYYFQPQRNVGSTWSSGNEKKETLRRSLSTGRYGTTNIRSCTSREGGSRDRRSSGGRRDENEYLFRYRR